EDPRDAEWLLERRPHVGAKAVAAREPQTVLRLQRIGSAVDEIPAQLADVLDERAVPPDDVAPEVPRGELLADHHRAAGHERRARRDDAADAVIERQAVVHAVARAAV